VFGCQSADRRKNFLGELLSDHSGEAKGSAVVELEHLSFLAGHAAEAFAAMSCAKLVPFPPELPALRKRVGEKTCFLPVPAPPSGPMEAAEFPGPITPFFTFHP
jgi:hypothetical protein